MRKQANLKHIQRERLYVDYRDDNDDPIRPPNDISSLGANRQKAFGRHRCGATVEQYLFSRYKRTLRFSDLPCVCVGSDYFPLECLRIVRKQQQQQQEEDELINEIEDKLNLSTTTTSFISSSSSP